MGRKPDMSDIEIAQQAVITDITTLAEKKLGLKPDKLESYGRYKAKVALDVLDDLSAQPDGKLILVTAISRNSRRRG